MSTRAKQDLVREWLSCQRDEQLRQAVFALQLLYHPDHLDTLVSMARRAGF